MPESPPPSDDYPSVTSSPEATEKARKKRLPGDPSTVVTQGEVIQETREIKQLLRYQITLMRQRIHIGPLPPAEEFQKYDQILDGAADRILRMAESEQSHGQAMDREALAADREIAK